MFHGVDLGADVHKQIEMIIDLLDQMTKKQVIGFALAISRLFYSRRKNLYL